MFQADDVTPLGWSKLYFLDRRDFTILEAAREELMIVSFWRHSIDVVYIVVYHLG